MSKDTSDKIVMRANLKALRNFLKCLEDTPADSPARKDLEMTVLEGQEILANQGKDSVAFNQYCQSLEALLKARR